MLTVLKIGVWDQVILYYYLQLESYHTTINDVSYMAL